MINDKKYLAIKKDLEVEFVEIVRVEITPTLVSFDLKPYFDSSLMEFFDYVKLIGANLEAIYRVSSKVRITSKGIRLILKY